MFSAAQSEIFFSSSRLPERRKTFYASITLITITARKQFPEDLQRFPVKNDFSGRFVCIFGPVELRASRVTDDVLHLKIIIIVFSKPQYTKLIAIFLYFLLTQDGQPGRRSNWFATGRRPGAHLTLVLGVISYCQVSDK